MIDQQEDIAEIIHEAIRFLPKRSVAILTARFGLEGGKPQTMREISESWGISIGRVRHLIDMALYRMREKINENASR